MEIVVSQDIGSKDVIDKINAELLSIKEILKVGNAEHVVCQIIVPYDFDETIRSILGDRNYFSDRGGQICFAKTIITRNGAIIVINKRLYGLVGMDGAYRYSICLHELFHAIHADRLKNNDNELYEELFFRSELNESCYSTLAYQNLYNLHVLFGEYFANRASLELLDVLFPDKNVVYYRQFNHGIKSYIDGLIKNNWKNAIVEAFSVWNKDHDTNRYLSSVLPIYEEVSKYFIHLLSCADHSGKSKVVDLIYDSFIDKKSVVDLVDLMRNMYSSNSNNYDDGLLIMEAFFDNFGLFFVEGIMGQHIVPFDIFNPSWEK